MKSILSLALLSSLGCGQLPWERGGYRRHAAIVELWEQHLPRDRADYSGHGHADAHRHHRARRRLREGRGALSYLDNGDGTITDLNTG